MKTEIDGSFRLIFNWHTLSFAQSLYILWLCVEFEIQTPLTNLIYSFEDSFIRSISVSCRDACWISSRWARSRVCSKSAIDLNIICIYIQGKWIKCLLFRGSGWLAGWFRAGANYTYFLFGIAGENKRFELKLLIWLLFRSRIRNEKNISMKFHSIHFCFLLSTPTIWRIP